MDLRTYKEYCDRIKAICYDQTLSEYERYIHIVGGPVEDLFREIEELEKEIKHIQ